MVAAACPARGPSTRGAERFTAALLTMQDGAAAVDLLAIPLPGNVFRRGIVAVYPNAYRFHELDWLDSPTPRQTVAPVTPCRPREADRRAALPPPRGA